MRAFRGPAVKAIEFQGMTVRFPATTATIWSRPWPASSATPRLTPPHRRNHRRLTPFDVRLDAARPLEW